MRSWESFADTDCVGSEAHLAAWLHRSDQGHVSPGAVRENGSSACTSIALSLVGRLENEVTIPVDDDLEDVIERGVRRHVRLCSDLSRSK